MTIKEAINLDGESIIPSIEVTVVGIYEINESAGGAYTSRRQNVKIKDSSGDGYLTLAGKKNQIEDGDHNSYVGKRIKVICGKSKKGDPVGLKLKVEEYKGKTYRKIWVTDSATIKVVGEGDSSPSKSSQQQPMSGSSGIIITEDFALSYARSWVKCYQAVEETFLKVIPKEAINERVTSIMISAARGEKILFQEANSKDQDTDEEETEETEETPDDEEETDRHRTMHSPWKEFAVNNEKTLGQVPLTKLASIIGKLLVSKRKHQALNPCCAAIKYLLSKDSRGEAEAKSSAAYSIIFSAFGKILSPDDVERYVNDKSIRQVCEAIISFSSPDDAKESILSDTVVDTDSIANEDVILF